MTVWRIVKARFAASAFDGEGARRSGGRWNTPGSRAVYTSATAALAALEMLVHLGRAASLPSYVLIACSFHERFLMRLDRTLLPTDWRSYPAPPGLQSIGDQWLRSGASLALEVPSALIETESNYLLNPEHPRFHSLTIARPVPFELDVRLLKG